MTTLDTTGRLAAAFLESHPEEAARELEALAVEHAAALLAAVPTKIASEVLARMVGPLPAACLAALEPETAGEIVAALEFDRAAQFVRQMPPLARAALLAALPDESAAPLTLLLAYPEGSAGALMDPRVLVLADDVTVGQALERIRRAADVVLHYVYVTDRSGVLTAVTSVRDLLRADEDAPLMSMARSVLARVGAGSRWAELVKHPSWRRYRALPVADRNGRLLGAIRHTTFLRLEERSLQEAARSHPSALLSDLLRLYTIVASRGLRLATPLLAALVRGTARSSRARAR